MPNLLHSITDAWPAPRSSTSFPAFFIVDTRYPPLQRRCPTCSAPSSTPDRFPPIVDARSPPRHHRRPPCSFPTVDAFPCRPLVDACPGAPSLTRRPTSPSSTR